MRRVAFAQLSLPGPTPMSDEAMKQPEDELGRLSRAIPLWFAETFYFSPLYSSIAALGASTSRRHRRPAIFPTDWTVENLKKLVETPPDGLDYIFTGSLKREGAEFVLDPAGLGGEEAARAQAVHGPLDRGDRRRRAHEAPRVRPRVHGMGPLPRGLGHPLRRALARRRGSTPSGPSSGSSSSRRSLLPKEQLPRALRRSSTRSPARVQPARLLARLDLAAPPGPRRSAWRRASPRSS
jgi:hypothetical protein